MSGKLDHESVEELAKVYQKDIHHPDDAFSNIAKLCALASSRDDPVSFFELGQTIFGCIEGLEFVQALLQKLNVDCPPVDLGEVRWYGLDISEYLNDLAVRLHQPYDVVTTMDFADVSGDVGVFFAKGVTLLYGTRSADELLKRLSIGRCAIFDYSFSMNGLQETTIGTGKTVVYLDLQEFREALVDSGRKLYIRRASAKVTAETHRVFVECVLGREDVCAAFIELDTKLMNALSEKAIAVPGLNKILPAEVLRNDGWVVLDEFVKTL
jgi:hypothetical protein